MFKLVQLSLDDLKVKRNKKNQIPQHYYNRDSKFGKELEKTVNSLPFKLPIIKLYVDDTIQHQVVLDFFK